METCKGENIRTGGTEEGSMKEKILFTIISLVICFLYGIVAAEEMKGAHSSHQHRHLEYAKIENPVAKTEKSVLQGRQLYEMHCIACHGKAGKGGIGPKLTGNARKHGGTDGEIFHVITDGAAGTAMKGFKKELTDEMRWHLVNYIDSLKTSKNL